MNGYFIVVTLYDNSVLLLSKTNGLCWAALCFVLHTIIPYPARVPKSTPRCHVHDSCKPDIACTATPTTAGTVHSAFLGIHMTARSCILQLVQLTHALTLDAFVLQPYCCHHLRLSRCCSSSCCWHCLKDCGAAGMGDSSCWQNVLHHHIGCSCWHYWHC